MLVPWAASLGARVIAVTSTEAKAEKARALGASDVIIGYEGVADKVKELTGGRGVDLVIDHTGSEFFGGALKCLARRGRLVVCGASSVVAISSLLNNGVSYSLSITLMYVRKQYIGGAYAVTRQNSHRQPLAVPGWHRICSTYAGAGAAHMSQRR